MLIAIDIGNSSTVIGLFVGRRLHRSFRVPTKQLKTAQGWRRHVIALLKKKRGPWDGAIVSSVVPAANRPLAKAFRAWRGQTPLVVNAALRLPIRLKTRRPKKIGTDRWVNAVAAYRKFGGPCLIVDFGTATTFDCVDRRGWFRGGAIAPGLDTAARALSARGAQLPRLRLRTPRRMVGRTTQEAMAAGVVGGYVGLVDGLIAKIIQESGPIPRKKIIATGGLATIVYRSSKMLGRLVPHLTLEGLQLIWNLNHS